MLLETYQGKEKEEEKGKMFERDGELDERKDGLNEKKEENRDTLCPFILISTS